MEALPRTIRFNSRVCPRVDPETLILAETLQRVGFGEWFDATPEKTLAARLSKSRQGIVSRREDTPASRVPARDRPSLADGSKLCEAFTRRHIAPEVAAVTAGYLIPHRLSHRDASARHAPLCGQGRDKVPAARNPGGVERAAGGRSGKGVGTFGDWSRIEMTENTKDPAARHDHLVFFANTPGQAGRATRQLGHFQKINRVIFHHDHITRAQIARYAKVEIIAHG